MVSGNSHTDARIPRFLTCIFVYFHICTISHLRTCILFTCRFYLITSYANNCKLTFTCKLHSNSDTIYLFIFVLMSFCHFVFWAFCNSCLIIFLSFLFFEFLSRNHSDQMSEGPQVLKVTIFVQILKWRSLSESVTKVRYRAARASKTSHLHSFAIS